MKFPYQKIEKMKPAYRLGILIATFVILAIIFYFVVFSTTNTKLTNLKKDVKQLEKEVAHLKSVEAKIIDIEKENNDVEVQLKRKEAEMVNSELFISEKNALHDVMQTFYQAAREVGLEKVDFKSDNEVPKAFYTELHFGFSAGGRYASILEFLQKIESEQRIININSFEMGRIGKLRELAKIAVDLPGQVFHDMQQDQVGSMVDFICKGYIYQIQPDKLMQQDEEDAKKKTKKKKK